MAASQNGGGSKAVSKAGSSSSSGDVPSLESQALALTSPAGRQGGIRMDRTLLLALLPDGISPEWFCFLCKRTRLEVSHNPKARPGLTLLSFAKETERSPCLSCFNYCRGALRGEPFTNIELNLKDQTKFDKYSQQIKWYEEELEKGNGRVVRLEQRASPPQVISLLNEIGQKATLVMPAFWPCDIFEGRYGKPIPDSQIAIFNYRGADVKGLYNMLC